MIETRGPRAISPNPSDASPDSLRPAIHSCKLGGTPLRRSHAWQPGAKSFRQLPIGGTTIHLHQINGLRLSQASEQEGGRSVCKECRYVSFVFRLALLRVSHPLLPSLPQSATCPRNGVGTHETPQFSRHGWRRPRRRRRRQARHRSVKPGNPLASDVRLPEVARYHLWWRRLPGEVRVGSDGRQVPDPAVLGR